MKYKKLDSLNLYYDDSKLMVEWDTSSADKYLLELMDASNGEILCIQYFEKETLKLPIAIESESFTPVISGKYKVCVYCIYEPDAFKDIEILDIGTPVVSGQPLGSGFRFSWDSVEFAHSYEFKVAKNGEELFRDNNIVDISYDYSANPEFEQGITYAAFVRAKSEQCYGGWSDSFEFEIHTKESVLEAIRDNLMKYADGDSVILSYESLNCYDFLKTKKIIEFFNQIFNSESITVYSALLPLTINDEKIAVKGVADVFSGSFNVIYDISLDSEMVMEVSATIRPGENWKFSNSFPVLDESYIDYMGIYDPRLEASKSGIIFNGKFTCTSDLKPSSKDNETYEIDIFGPLSVSGNEVTFSFAGSVAESFSFELVDSIVDINGDSLLFVRGETGEESYTISGYSIFNEKSVPALLNMVPDAAEKYEISLTVTEAFGKFEDFLSVVDTKDRYGGYFPDALKTLSLINLSGFKLFFSTWNDIEAVYEYNVDVDSVFSIIPDVFSIEDVMLNIRLYVCKYQEKIIHEFRATLEGVIVLTGGISTDINIDISTDKDWQIEFVNPSNFPALSYIAGLIGLQTGDIIGILPESLQTILSISLNDLLIQINPFEGVLKRLEFTLIQTKDWVIVPNVLVLKDCELYFNFIRGDVWDICCDLTASLEIGTNTLAASVYFTSQAETFTITSIGEYHIPSIETLLGFIGGGDVLPKGISTFGAIDINRLEIVYSIRQKKITSVLFQIEQSQDWEIIENALTVTDFQSMFNIVYNDEDQLDALGFADGFINVAEDTPILIGLLCSVLGAVYNLYEPHKFVVDLALALKEAGYGIDKVKEVVKGLYGEKWNDEDELKIDEVYKEIIL